MHFKNVNTHSVLIKFFHFSLLRISLITPFRKSFILWKRKFVGNIVYKDEINLVECLKNYIFKNFCANRDNAIVI